MTLELLIWYLWKKFAECCDRIGHTDDVSLCWSSWKHKSTQCSRGCASVLKSEASSHCLQYRHLILESRLSYTIQADIQFIFSPLKGALILCKLNAFNLRIRLCQVWENNQDDVIVMSSRLSWFGCGRVQTTFFKQINRSLLEMWDWVLLNLDHVSFVTQFLKMAVKKTSKMYKHPRK